MAGLRIYLDLTKFGIVVFVLLVGLAAYLMAVPAEQPFRFSHLLSFVAGLYFLASGSLALNQVQEWKIDQKMPRTQKRPIASGRLRPLAGAILAVTLILMGNHFLLQTSVGSFVWGLISVILYNGFYTLWWKPKYPMAAVFLGALPGAVPIFIGYVAFGADWYELPSLLMFLILFMWQMPHFWLIAYRYRDDYARADIPTLPVIKGEKETIRQITRYFFAYLGIVLLGPLFLDLGYFYITMTIPMSLLGFILWRHFDQRQDGRRWFLFFMWTNLSVLVFLMVPVMARWRLIVKAFAVEV